MEDFKKQKGVPCIKRIVKKNKIPTNLSVFFQMFLKFMKGVCMIRSMIFFLNKYLRYQRRLCKGFNTKNALLSMVEKMLLGRDK